MSFSFRLSCLFLWLLHVCTLLLAISALGSSLISWGAFGLLCPRRRLDFCFPFFSHAPTPAPYTPTHTAVQQTTRPTANLRKFWLLRRRREQKRAGMEAVRWSQEISWTSAATERRRALRSTIRTRRLLRSVRKMMKRFGQLSGFSFESGPELSRSVSLTHAMGCHIPIVPTPSATPNALPGPRARGQQADARLSSIPRWMRQSSRTTRPPLLSDSNRVKPF